MTLKSVLPRPWLTLTLVALILVTRTNPSTLIINPPDISLAAFFLAGLWISSVAAFAWLFAAAVVADLLSFTLGVSAWCFTPAYVFLVPTYACLWYAGHLCRNENVFRVVGAAKLAVALVVAGGAAYLISTYSFFWFSGQLTDARSIQAYQDGIPRYFLPYLGWAVLYTAIALAIAAIVRGLKPATESSPVDRKGDR